MIIRVCFFLIFAIYIHVFAAGSFAFWPVFGANPQRDGRTQGQGPSNPGIKWRAQGFYMYGSAVVDKDGTIYAAGDDALYAIGKNGRKIWQYREEGSVLNFPVMPPSGGDTIYLLSVKRKDLKNYLVAIDKRHGKKIWAAFVSDYGTERWLSHIAVSSNEIIYAHTGNTLAAFDRGGIMLWSYTFPLNPRQKTPYPAVAPVLSPDEKTIYLLLRTKGGLYAFNSDGKIKWHDKTDYYTDFSPPTVSPEGIIYIADYTSKAIHAIRPDGKKIWQAPFPDKHLANSGISISKDGTTLYVDIANASYGVGGGIYALDKTDGRVKWMFEIKDGYLGSRIAVDYSGNIYCADGTGYIHSLAPDGKLNWSFSIGRKWKVRTDTALSQIFYSSPALSDKTLYIINGDGTLFAIGR